MKHALLTTVFSTLLLFFPVTPTHAQYVAPLTSQPNRQMMIEKKILNPSNNQFVDNLNIDQHTFLPNQDVTFRVTITNVIQADLKNIVVTDQFPQLLSFVSTSFGNFDDKTRTILFKIDSLKAGESKTIEIKAKIKPEIEISSNVTCQSNIARAMVNNMSDEDTATFCVSKQVLITNTQMPTTGPADTLPFMVLSTLFLAIGLLTKRIVILERR